ncbi:MAG: fibronectin type III domain-containing protein, partial [Thermodesulfovibrionales bacterium]|nr:fibronectin type III domain-containing protein [Thermodesulfovibrionales bacterium]
MHKRLRAGLIISCCLLVLLLLTVVAASPLDAGLKQKLAVFPFIAKNMEAMTLTESLSSLLLNSIDRAGYFEILERKKVENIIELEGLRLKSLSKEDILKIGARNNIDFLLCGTATRVGRTVAIEIQLFSVRENKICFTDTIRTSEGELAAKLYSTAQDIVMSSKKCLSPDPVAVSERKPLAMPENIKISGTSKSIRINWTHQDMSNLIGFKIFRSNNADGPFTQIATTIENFYTDENLKLNETFYYRVKAIDKKGTDSEFSLSVVGKTSIAPQPPIFLNIQDNVKGAYLQWRSRPHSGKESDNVEAGYKVFRKVQAEKEFKEVAVV